MCHSGFSRSSRGASGARRQIEHADRPPRGKRARCARSELVERARSRSIRFRAWARFGLVAGSREAKVEIPRARGREVDAAQNRRVTLERDADAVATSSNLANPRRHADRGAVDGYERAGRLGADAELTQALLRQLLLERLDAIEDVLGVGRADATLQIAAVRLERATHVAEFIERERDVVRVGRARQELVGFLEVVRRFAVAAGAVGV